MYLLIASSLGVICPRTDLVNQRISCIEELNKSTGDLAKFDQDNQRDYDSEIHAAQRRVQEIEDEVHVLYCCSPCL